MKSNLLAQRGLALALVMGLLSVATVAPSAASPESASEAQAALAPYCAATSESPHVSSGAGGVILKGRATCYNTAARMELVVELQVCGGPDGICAPAARGERTINNPSNGVRYTQYAPPTGQSGATPNRWYRGFVNAQYFDADGNLIGYDNGESSIVYVSG